MHNEFDTISPVSSKKMQMTIAYVYAALLRNRTCILGLTCEVSECRPK